MLKEDDVAAKGVTFLVLAQIDLHLEESPDPGMPKALIDYHR